MDRMDTPCEGTDTFRMAEANYDKCLGEGFGWEEVTEDVERNG